MKRTRRGQFCLLVERRGESGRETHGGVFGSELPLVRISASREVVGGWKETKRRAKGQLAKRERERG